jgi:hypothetical protein
MIALTLCVYLIDDSPVLAQGPTLSNAECQNLRQKLAEHARLSEGVRRAVAAQAGAAPAAPAAAAPSAGRAETLRSRLDQIPRERQTLEDQRLGAMVKFEFSRAGQIQAQIQGLDTEKASLERELAAALPAGPSLTPVPQAAVSDPTTRILCQDVAAAVDNALKIRRRELGARDDQAGAIPLTGSRGQTAEQIGQELAAQFSPGAAATTQVGLFDPDGDGRLDGFVDVLAPGIVRLVRQRPDGTVSIEVFSAPGATAGYGELTRRLDETTARQTGQTLPELLAVRPAGPLRVITQTAEFGPAHAQFQAGNFADVARLGSAAARSVEFQNLRGQGVRVLEIVSPVAGGVSLLWEETTTIVRPISYWRTDVEVARSRATRTTSGALVGAPSVSPVSRFSLER